MSKPAFKKGDEIGPYVIEGVFSIGGMGVVYRVKSEQVLIKSPFADSSAEILEQFQEEVTALKKLEHPGIVKILDYGVHEHIPWYAMQRLTGENLRDRLQREHRFPCIEALRIEYKIVQAMAYAHSRSKPVWHRDLKPDNICLENRRPVILDFGLARLGTESAGILPPHGTILYMAPEQIRGHADGRSDVYSLGVILYEMLTGVPPFSGRPDADALESIMDLDIPCPSLPDEIDRSIVVICDKSLAKRPELRYADATEMVADIKFALRKQIKTEALLLEQAKNYHAAAAFLREAVEYGLPMIELEEFWKFRLGQSLKIILIDPSSIEPAKKALRLQNHPNLVPILEVVEGEFPYLVTAATAGEPLTKRIAQRNCLSLMECVELCRAVRSSMEAVKDADLDLVIEERRIFSGDKFYIGGLHRARPGYREMSAQNLAQILVRALTGSLSEGAEKLPDLFRDLLQIARQGQYGGNAVDLTHEIESFWKDQEKHLHEITQLKGSLGEDSTGPNPEIVDRLVSLFLGDYRETVRSSAKEALEGVFDSENFSRDELDAIQPQPLSDPKKEPPRKEAIGITEKIAAFLGALVTADPTLETPQETTEFIRFLEKAAPHPSKLSPAAAQQIFREFLYSKSREVGQSLEKERLQFQTLAVEKEKTISGLEQKIQELKEAVAAKESIISQKEQILEDFRRNPPTPTALDKIARSIGKTLVSGQAASAKIPREVLRALRSQIAWHLNILIGAGEQILYHIYGERSTLTGREKQIEEKVQEVVTKAVELKSKVEAPAAELDVLISYLVIAEYMRQRFFDMIKRENIAQYYGGVHISLSR